VAAGPVGRDEPRGAAGVGPKRPDAPGRYHRGYLGVPLPRPAPGDRFAVIKTAEKLSAALVFAAAVMLFLATVAILAQAIYVR